MAKFGNKIFLAVGLGNAGEEYQNTRHNTGRLLVEAFSRQKGFAGWRPATECRALIAHGKIGSQNVLLAAPETLMNKSGEAVKKLVAAFRPPAAAGGIPGLIIVHDDLDLPLGKIKIAFNRGAGGHRGVQSVEKNLKTRKFTRIRVGISPATPSGKIKKPRGEKAVVDFILGKFRKPEMEKFKKVSQNVSAALETIVSEGSEKAMGKWN